MAPAAIACSIQAYPRDFVRSVGIESDAGFTLDIEMVAKATTRCRGGRQALAKARLVALVEELVGFLQLKCWKMASDMRVLVTGSSGFLGRQVALHLSSDHEVETVGFDLIPPLDDAFPAIEADLCDPEALGRACQRANVVVHFGGVGDVDAATRHPDLAARANVAGTRSVAEAAAAAGARVVYASTWEVYGPAVYEPVNEQHPCAPRHVYATTKLAGEDALGDVHRRDGLPVIILRLGTAYGPGMRPNTVFRRFADAGRQGEALQVQGAGSQWRQFTHTSDIAGAVRRAVDSDLTCTLNIVADEATTILQLAEIVAARYGVAVRFDAERPGDPPSARITSEKAAQVLGWHAGVDFHHGLTQLLDQFDREHRKVASGGDTRPG